MALSRRGSQRMSSNIWPGFVDAMTGLLLVLMFVLTIFMVVQYVLRETITGQESELDQLGADLNALSAALGIEQQRNSVLEETVGGLNAELEAARATETAQAALIAGLQGQVADGNARIATFEEQVATLLSERDAARAEGVALTADLEALQGENATLISEQEALQLALAQARDEIDEQVEAARLAAARREALGVLIADLQRFLL